MLAAMVLAAWTARAGGGYTVVSETGPANNRINIVFLGDGYTADQIDTAYAQHVEDVMAHFFDAGEDPFPRYRNFFNIYRVDVVSNESGADIPAEGITRDTALDATYSFGGGPDRLLYVNDGKASAAMQSALAGSGIMPRMKLITVNETRYGGGGAQFAVFAGGNALAGELALHEMGHSFAGLADEYVDANHTSSEYHGWEPYQPNVTADSTGAKWSQWLGYEDSLGTVGAYEGAMNYGLGVYRATPTSKMRALNQKFNAVAREQFILDIYNLDLSADLVVLSACNTALGTNIRGEGLVGLVRGFMYAGAARVAASLWSVDDESTAGLMKEFYRGMYERGRSPAAALREAQMTLWRSTRWNRPYYWAGFILQGDYR